MKKLFTVIFCVGLAAPLFADGTNQLTDDKSRVSYALGMLNGHAWKAQDIDVNVDLYMQGIKDGLAGGATLVTGGHATTGDFFEATVLTGVAADALLTREETFGPVAGIVKFDTIG